MGETPSKRRRKGRDAYCKDCDPMDFQPYKVGSWGYENYLQDFLDGWKEAEEAEKAEELEEAEESVLCSFYERSNKEKTNEEVD